MDLFLEGKLEVSHVLISNFPNFGTDLMNCFSFTEN